MFKKTAIALSLAMVAGTGFAAQNGASTHTNSSASVGAGGANAGMSSSASAEFRALDTNSDGMISRTEASKSPALAKAYDSFDTSGTIEDKAKNGKTGGITPEQFEAGMQAAHSKSGAMGDSVSGGGTYIQMKDGSQKLKEKSSSMKHSMGDNMSNMKQRSSDAMSSAGGQMKSQSQSTMGKSNTMRDEVKTRSSDGYQKARTMGSDAYDGAAGSADKARMQGEAAGKQRMKTPAGSDAGMDSDVETKANY